jgi:YbgC/YbaW family acyl-CoA thioester hydrolase
MPEPFPGLRVTVPSTHIDMFGHVNHARYLEYMEWARFAWAAHGGQPIPEMVARGFGPAILRAEVHYRRECFLGEELLVGVEPLSARRSIGRLRQRVVQLASGEVACEATMTFAMIDLKARRVAELPEVFLGQLR